MSFVKQMLAVQIIKAVQSAAQLLSTVALPLAVALQPGAVQAPACMATP